MSTRSARILRTMLVVAGGLLAGLAALGAWIRFGGRAFRPESTP